MIGKSVRRGTWKLFALTLFLSAGCRDFQGVLTPPEHNGPPWIELESTHFVLETDNAAEDAHAMLIDLERSFAAISAAISQDTEPHGKTEIVVFRRREDYQAIANPWTEGYFTTSTLLDLDPQILIVTHGVTLDDNIVVRETIQHELTHRFIHEKLLQLPPWLDEGLAQYFSTLRIQGDEIVLGKPRVQSSTSDQLDFTRARELRQRQAQIPLAKTPTVRELLAFDSTTFYGGADPQDQRAVAARYTAAWTLVHLLANGRDDADRKRFVELMTAVWSGANTKQAFASIYPESEIPRLEEAYGDYLLQHSFRVRVLPYRPFRASPPEHERVLSNAEVHLLWARSIKKGSTRSAKAEIETALALDPSLEVRFRHAVYLYRTNQKREAARELDALLEARPDEPRYLYARIVCDSDRDPPWTAEDERMLQALHQRLARVAASALQLDTIAQEYARQSNPTLGLPFAERSISADPTCWTCVDTYSVLLFEAGKVVEALAANARATALVSEIAPPTALRTHRAQFEAAPVGKANPRGEGEPIKKP